MKDSLAATPRDFGAHKVAAAASIADEFAAKVPEGLSRDGRAETILSRVVERTPRSCARTLEIPFKSLRPALDFRSGMRTRARFSKENIYA